MNPSTPDTAGPARDSPRAVVQQTQPAPAPRYVSADSLREAEARLLAQMASNYRPMLPVYSARGAEVLGWYFFADVEVMRLHPDVFLPLQYVMGPMGYGEWEIEGSSYAAALFAAKMMQWYWQNALPEQYEEGAIYGWAANELEYTERDGLLVFDKATTFSARDTTALLVPDGPRKGQAIGVRVINMLHGPLDLWAFREDVPNKSIWYAHRPRGGMRFGESQIRGAWRFWRRQAGIDGLEEISDLASHRFGTGIVKVLHPNTLVPAEEAGLPQYGAGQEVHTRDIARFLASNMKAGAGVSISSEQWPQMAGGGPKWDVRVESFNTNISQLGEHDDRLARKMSKAIGVPPELFEAAQTGSGYSGRAIPLQGFLIGQQRYLQRWTSTVMKQGIEPLVRWNYGKKAWVRATPRPLTESVRKSSWESPGDPNSMVPQRPPMSQGVDAPPAGGDEGGGAPQQMMATPRPDVIDLVVTRHRDGSLSAELPTDPANMDLPELLAARQKLREHLS